MSGFEDMFSTERNHRADRDETKRVEVRMSSSNHHPAAARGYRLPLLNTLEPPERLFPWQTPYQLVVKAGHNSIIVQGSH